MCDKDGNIWGLENYPASVKVAIGILLITIFVAIIYL